ncbi:tape measure protein [Nostoc edaphicum CCNP1411]|uniref:Tape measure protein n=1 Tax=Nostoc edaphicum CCNP1411 TaxID=1472755 RepID=A0A7D7LGF8_9NOSO|nr:tape measure protein [Nostoc edaphicum]QMS91354.1 tape measure protein [Nostoc edaphicum CCNP1411]
MDLGQLVIGLAGDYSQLQRDIEQAKIMALRQASQLEKNFRISPSLDTKALQSAAESAGISAGKTIAKSLESSLNSYKFSNASFKKAGQEIAKGLSAGIKQGENQVKNASAQMAVVAIDETKRKLKIRSPSKVFMDIGGDIAAGLAAGIATGGTLAIANLVESTINAARSAVDSGLAFTGDSISKYSNFKSISTQLETIQGSATAAADSLKFLRLESDRLALPMLSSAKGFASLTAATRGTALEGQKTRDIFTGIATAAREANLSNDDFNGVLLATQQIISKGKVQAEELRGQIGERLPGAFTKAAKSIGVTTSQLDKLLESGQLTAEVFLPAFTRELSNVSTANITKATDNSASALTRLNNRLDELKISLGQAIEPGVVAGLNFAQKTLSELGQAGLFDDLNKSAKDFSEYLKQNPQLAKETANIIRSALKDAIASTVELSKKLANYLSQNPTALKDATNAIGSFGKGLSDSVAYAKQMLGIFQNIGKSIDLAYDKASKLLGGTPEQQGQFKNFLKYGPAALFQSPTSPNVKSNFKAASPLAGVSLEKLLAYQPTPGQGFYGMRDGGRRRHSKIDFDSRVGAGEGAVAQAALSGSATMRQITSTSAGIDIATTDANGKRVTVVYNHLRLGDIQKLFGGQKQIQVSAGQALGRITKDALSTGAHLDFGIKVNGSYVEPQKFIRDYIQPMSKAGAVGALSSISKPTAPTATGGNWMRTIASTYGAGDGFDGQKTSSGERFNQNALTAAMNENLKKNLGVKWGDRVEAVNPANGRKVTVRITDHGPYERKDGRYVPHSTRGLDLSTAAAKEIGISLGEVAFRVLGKTNTQTPSNSKLVSSVAPPSQALAAGNQPPEIRSILEGQELKEIAARRQKFREAAAQMQQSLQQARDLEFSAVKNPSLSDRQAEEARKLQQRYDDALREAIQRQQDSQSRLGINNARMGSGSVPEQEAKDLQLQIALDKKSVTELDGVIKQLSNSRAQATKELAVFHAQQSATRQRGVNFEAMTQEVAILQAQIQGLKQLPQQSPGLDNLPKLERELSLKQTQLDLEKKIFDLSDREFKKEIDPIQAETRLEQLRRENDALLVNINAQYQASEAAIALSKARRELAATVKENTTIAEGLRSQSQLRGYGIGTGDRLAMERDATALDLKSRYAQDKFSLFERAREEQLTPTQTNGERVRLALRFNESNLLNNANYQRQSKDESITNARYLQQTDIDLLAGKAESLQGLGLDYSSRNIQKQVAVLNQGLSFQDAIAELERLRETSSLTVAEFTQAKDNLEAINNIKLESINSEFSQFSDVIKGIQTDSQSAFKDLILNTEDFGSAISKIFESILDNLASMASQMLSDQLFGTIFGMKGQGSSGDNGGFGSILSTIGGLFGSGTGGGSDFSSFLGGSDGGFSMIPGFSSGGMVGDIARSMSQERAISGYEPRLIIANVGERVLNPEETKIWNRLQSAGRLPSYASGGMVGGNGSSVQSNSNSGVNVGGISVTIAGSEAPNYNIPQLKKILEAKIQEGIKDSRRPGGSLTRGSIYGR